MVHFTCHAVANFLRLSCCKVYDAASISSLLVMHLAIESELFDSSIVEISDSRMSEKSFMEML